MQRKNFEHRLRCEKKAVMTCTVCSERSLSAVPVCLSSVCNTTALGTWAVRPATSDMVQMVYERSLSTKIGDLE